MTPLWKRSGVIFVLPPRRRGFFVVYCREDYELDVLCLEENKTLKRLAVGLLAHVDAGKTTLAEALLYRTGSIKSQGRVDHGDTAMDYNELERARGITIFASQAPMRYGDLSMTLLDTPGHVDFSAETERILQVLDYAVLVISGLDGVQAHTRTLWKLLGHYHVPTVLFVTKMDLARHSREALLADLSRSLSDRVLDFGASQRDDEALAMCREEALETYLERGAIPDEMIARMIAAREVFPCLFGSGLKLDGMDELLGLMARFFLCPDRPRVFGARVFKITHDAQGNRLTHVKLTGGTLRVREPIAYNELEEKVSQIRIYTGGKYVAVDQAEAGDVCALIGLSQAQNGQGLGIEASGSAPVLEPVMVYRIQPPVGVDPRLLLPQLKKLEAEDPQLHLSWDARLQQIQVGLMGAVQGEILKAMVQDRFDTQITLDQGRVLYKETIETTTEGVGHYEPLRHYAEVHLILEPGKRGSGLVFASKCSEDLLDRNWQRLILTHLAEKQHLGVLIGAPITDLKITLAAGRAHQKHTEGGDFRQATYRAVRQGLMQARSRLLEPWYNFRLEVPTEQVGRAITDIRARSGSFETPEELGGMSLIRGRGPVAALNDYAMEVAAYSRGRGRFFCEPGGYDLCHNEQAVIEAAAYDPEADLDNSPDSVFCAHGAGFVVKWDQVFANMHLESVLAKPKEAALPRVNRRNLRIDEKELQAILEREFGPIRRPVYSAPARRAEEKPAPAPLPERPQTKYLVVDGYNVIFAWDDLAALAQTDLEQAREQLMDILANYTAFTRTETILVFDAYRVKGNVGQRFDHNGLHVVYTRENETGDMYIEKLCHDIGKNEQVRIITSDGLIQLSAVRSGVLRMSAAEFGKEIDAIYGDIAQFLQSLHSQRLGSVGDNLQAKEDGHGI